VDDPTERGEILREWELEIPRKTLWTRFKENFIEGLARSLGWGIGIVIIVLFYRCFLAQ
jgi:hypothetical protein